MFTGIIADLGRVAAVLPAGASPAGLARFTIETGFDVRSIALGASIACSGACLSVIETAPNAFVVEVSAETLSRTTLGAWRPGTRVNLERALRAGDELGGHLVTGHVDDVALVADRQPDGGSLRLTVAVPPALAGLIAAKGSVALDGVSLTVNEVDGTRFGVNLIPLTQQLTTLGQVRTGESVNLEIDLLARYVARLLERGTA
jgi:riboflavin synthase